MESDFLLDTIPLTDGISIVEIAAPEPWLGKTLGNLDLRNRFGVLTIMIKELIPEKVTMIPTADQMIKDSDILILLGKDEDLEKIKNL